MIAILINMPIETMDTRGVRPNVYTWGAAMLRIRRAHAPKTKKSRELNSSGLISIRKPREKLRSAYDHAISKT